MLKCEKVNLCGKEMKYRVIRRSSPCSDGGLLLAGRTDADLDLQYRHGYCLHRNRQKERKKRRVVFRRFLPRSHRTCYCFVSS